MTEDWKHSPPPAPKFVFAGHEPEFATAKQRQIPIWRYMDLAKFVALLSSRALYFTRDRFEDPFEGSISREQLEQRLSYHRTQRGLGHPIRLTQHAHVLVEDAIPNTAINCWHASEHESAAMWKLYAPAGWLGVAVRSTYQRLVASLPRRDRRSEYVGPWMRVLPIRVAPVRYIDYERHRGPKGDTLLHKRKSFEHEHEIRAVAQDRHSFQGDPRDGALALRRHRCETRWGRNRARDRLRTPPSCRGYRFGEGPLVTISRKGSPSRLCIPNQRRPCIGAFFTIQLLQHGARPLARIYPAREPLSQVRSLPRIKLALSAPHLDDHRVSDAIHGSSHRPIRNRPECESRPFPGRSSPPSLFLRWPTRPQRSRFASTSST